jgi:FO synthase
MDHAATQRLIRRALGRARRGAALDAGEAAALLAARGDDLAALADIAGRVRDAGLTDEGRPATVTYSPKVFIPLTRLCRDRCHYCTFASDPAALRRAGTAEYLSPSQVGDIARAGAAAGCAEALFTLGDTPEDRWPQAARWLSEAGYDSTLSYLRACAISVLETTGLLPHLNPGVLSWHDLRRLRPVAASMGLMLETSARRLFDTPGEVHHGSPDKDPEVRLRVITDAGRLSIPFTTGVLLGIGETPQEFVQSILDIRRAARDYGHIQEVLVQNFRAKQGTAAHARPDPDSDTHTAAVAVARLLLGPRMRLQIPPNLSDPATTLRLVAAGADDLGGISPVTPDHVNPERPWPHLADLSAALESVGLRLMPRLAVHPGYVHSAAQWIDPRLHPHVGRLATADGLLRAPAAPAGLPWQEPDPGYEGFAARSAGGRVDLADAVDADGRFPGRRADFDSVYGDWAGVARGAAGIRSLPAARVAPDLRAALDIAERDPAALAEPRHRDAAVALMASDGAALERLCELADAVRAAAVGGVVTYVVNRNLNFTNVCYTGCRFCAFAQRESDPDAFTLDLSQVGERVDEAAAAGATEICMQGGIHPALPGTAYFDLAREVKRRNPRIHLHAFSPMEVVNGASRAGMSVADWLAAARDAGVDSLPGTAAEILDDEVRWVLTKGKLPAAEWIEVITTAHQLGLPTTATMMYGHVDRPEHWVDHLRTIRSIQTATGGFTEFVPLPFIHQQSPIYLAGVARPGPSVRDNRAVHAMARLMLHGAIDHIQCSWVKLGPSGCEVMLRGGADDLGGTLMEETISRMAGSGHGSSRTAAELAAIAAAAGRPAAQRDTFYRPIPPASVDKESVVTQDVP